MLHQVAEFVHIRRLNAQIGQLLRNAHAAQPGFHGLGRLRGFFGQALETGGQGRENVGQNVGPRGVTFQDNRGQQRRQPKAVRQVGADRAEGVLQRMTYTSIIFLLWRSNVPFNSREAVSQALLWGDFSLAAFLRQILGLVFGIEGVAAFLLWLHDPVFFYPFSALFHAVSAFCNAGFALSTINLGLFRDDLTVNLIIAFSVILGGIGFGVLRELLGICTGGRMGAPVRRLSRFSRMVLKTSLMLIVLGWALMFAIEFSRGSEARTLAGGTDLAITMFFHSVVARTAGFSTIDIATLGDATLLVLMMLMFIGGAPGSCAGGIKVVTFRVLVGYIAAQFKGDHQIVLEGRGVTAENVTRALTLFFIYSLLVGVSVFLLTITEDGILTGRDGPSPSLLRLLFEEVSALGTVGLSVDMAGPSVYFGTPTPKPWLGPEPAEAAPWDAPRLLALCELLRFSAVYGGAALWLVTLACRYVAVRG